MVNFGYSKWKVGTLAIISLIIGAFFYISGWGRGCQLIGSDHPLECFATYVIEYSMIIGIMLFSFLILFIVVSLFQRRREEEEYPVASKNPTPFILSLFPIAAIYFMFFWCSKVSDHNKYCEFDGIIPMFILGHLHIFLSIYSITHYSIELKKFGKSKWNLAFLVASVIVLLLFFTVFMLIK